MKDEKKVVKKGVVFTFGRFNPPTTGHAKLVDKLKKASSGGYNVLLFTSHSNDKKKNPLQDGKNIGYMNGLWLNKTLREQESWTAKDIEKRTELLVKKAIQLFSFNSEN